MCFQNWNHEIILLLDICILQIFFLDFTIAQIMKITAEGTENAAESTIEKVCQKGA